MRLHYCVVKGWARSLARIKVSAFGAGDRGFKSHRARFGKLFEDKEDLLNILSKSHRARSILVQNQPTI